MAGKRLWGTLDPFVESGDILGRKVANNAFLRALLTVDPFDGYHFFLSTEGGARDCQEWLAREFPALYRRDAFCIRLQTSLHRALAETPYHCFHLSDCLGRQVRLQRFRNAFSRTFFPITGVTHSLSYERFMPEFLSHLWPGCSSRDAVVATSRCAAEMLQTLFSRLRSSYSLPDTFAAPRVSTIPLAITPPPPASPEAREHIQRVLRQRLGLGQDTPLPLLFLCVGRLSVQSKMDFLPVLAACKRAEAEGLAPRSYFLVLAGWADEGDALPDALHAMAAARGIRLVPLVRPTDEERNTLYELADVFIAPSDNIQETFGLTVLEAGGAGLPVIAADFSGYRDTVQHDITGLLVPTTGFSSSSQTNTQAALWYDNQYHFALAQQVALDVPSLGEAIRRLGTDAMLRQSMGQAARKRVATVFSWESVIAQYCRLWDELAATPLSATEASRLHSVQHPLCMDFAAFFNTFFTQTLTPEQAEALFLRRTSFGESAYRSRSFAFPYAGLELMLDKDVLRKLLFLTRKSIPALQALEGLIKELRGQSAPDLGATEDRGTVGIEGKSGDALYEEASRHLLWALKHDYVEIVHPIR